MCGFERGDHHVEVVRALARCVPQLGSCEPPETTLTGPLHFPWGIHLTKSLKHCKLFRIEDIGVVAMHLE
jgi:hypothetical protein